MQAPPTIGGKGSLSPHLLIAFLKSLKVQKQFCLRPERHLLSSGYGTAKPSSVPAPQGGRMCRRGAACVYFGTAPKFKLSIGKMTQPNTPPMSLVHILRLGLGGQISRYQYDSCRNQVVNSIEPWAGQAHFRTPQTSRIVLLTGFTTRSGHGSGQAVTKQGIKSPSNL